MADFGFEDGHITSATSGRRAYSGGFSQQQPDFGHVDDDVGEVGREGGD